MAKISDIPILEKPRERFELVGRENITNEELLAIILKTGTKNVSSKELGSSLLNKYGGIGNFKDITVNSLCKIKGIGRVKAIELVAALELGKRVYYKAYKYKIKVNNSSLIYEAFKDEFLDENQELFYVLYLDTKKNLIKYEILFKGTVDASLVHPREVFKEAFLCSASSIVCIHNHPSGDPTPSNKDVEITNVLTEVGRIMGISLVDHIIIGNNKYYSFYENYHK